MVTSKVSGMSTITRSSTPKHVMRRPDPGTTIPPATCSVSTGQKYISIRIRSYQHDGSNLPKWESPRIRGWLASAGNRSAREEKSPTSSQPAMCIIYHQSPTRKIELSSYRKWREQQRLALQQRQARQLHYQ